MRIEKYLMHVVRSMRSGYHYELSGMLRDESINAHKFTKKKDLFIIAFKLVKRPM